MQFITLSEQFRSIMWAILFGAFCAAVYDAVRAVRYFLSGNGRGSVTLANIFDLLYSVFLGTSYSIFVYLANSGKNRWYLLFSSVFGFVLYRLSVGRAVKPLLGKTSEILRKIIRAVIKALAIPERKLFKLIKTVLGKIRARRKYKKAEKEKERAAKLSRVGRETVRGAGEKTCRRREKRV